MASFTTLSRLTRSLFRISEWSTRPASHWRNLCTSRSGDEETEERSGSSSDSSESDSDVPENAIEDQPASPSLPTTGLNQRGFPYLLENGMDAGIYKAILVGQVGQSPMQKKLKSGRTVTLFSVGTGGIRNNRRPFDNEDPKEYAGRCAVQWHRTCIYPEPLGRVAMEHVKSGSILYIEGNLETKVFTDPITGLPRRLREIAIRGDEAKFSNGYNRS
ncbi:Single-stranded DNA-binding protein [Nymphaea thermarum]|nr:Single-stranded DNA-binding protein [Nymphaea thermarum]